MHLAYTECKPEAAALSFEEWYKKKAERSPQFQFLQLVLKIELDVMTRDRAIHEGNFLLYMDALMNLQWLFHAPDHYNYVHAVAIRLQDVGTLQVKHPDVFRAFCEGKFTVKTHRPFSGMPLDESHEQNNACMKEDGGAVSLTEKPVELLRWMVAGLEMARVVNEFLCGLEKTEATSQPSHHEDNPGKTIMCGLI